MLDDRFEKTSDKRGHFQFRILYHPRDCIVTLSTRAGSSRALVANCGPDGDKGARGDGPCRTNRA